MKRFAPSQEGAFSGQLFAKFGLSKADFPSRTCRAARGPADVRHGQLAALPILKFDKSAY